MPAIRMRWQWDLKNRTKHHEYIRVLRYCPVPCKYRKVLGDINAQNGLMVKTIQCLTKIIRFDYKRNTYYAYILHNRVSFTRCYWNGPLSKWRKKVNSYCFRKNEQIRLAFDNYIFFIVYTGSHGGLFFWKQFFHQVFLHGYATLGTNSYEPVKQYVQILVESSYDFRSHWNNALNDFFYTV